MFRCGSINGDISDIFWFTEGDSDKWPVLVGGVEADYAPDRFEMNLTEFILRLYRDEIKSTEVPRSYEKIRSPVFAPDYEWH